ncbi:glycoside hydrolase family 3 N-terminal domain-containing protein [Brachybacterium tyrofermentans]|uniref:glycoside hydrolase family 3 N-terminal domain-containing protein n=1 Tax=Brachybacterium tyrofermentans TaxID=47848 RepID=UPI003FD0C4DA
MSTSDLAPAALGTPCPADQRRLDQARALVAQMDLRERIAMLHQYSPGVERLGIAPFVTGTEGVHGVAWKGVATQFPQPVGMAASWDPELLAAAAAVTAQEVRELHAADPSVSLSVWAPVVNTLRHPLWGRTEEAYTEDPLLNSVLAGGFSRGLRGEGETWQVLPTLKHFLAYSNETDRCATSSELSQRVLHEYELPGFVEPVVSGLAASVMLSYNLVNGRPAHLTDLLESQLRSRLPDPDLLFVVTDAGAPSNLFRAEKVVPDAASAYAGMLRAGADSFTDHDTDPRESIEAITEALERGLIDVEHVDRAVVRQLVARARTGEFDSLPGGPDVQPSPGAQRISPLPSDPNHPQRSDRRALSREVAVRSAVLLARADTAALPLRQGPLAVLGEQAHAVLSDWYSGDLHSPTSLATALRDAAEEPSEVRTSRVLDRIGLELIGTGSVPGVPSGTQEPEPVLLASDASLRLHRPAADVPRSSLPGAAAFEVIDLGEDVIALRETTTDLLVTTDDRGQLVATGARIGGWVVQETFRRVVAVDGTWQLQHIGSGRFVGLEHHTGALILRSALPGSGARFAARVHESASTAFEHAVDGAGTVVLAVGNEPHVHGRETEDRPHVRLSGPDRTAVERLASLPADVATVLVITSSYPYDLEGFEERVGAVVWSSHAGEAEGEALADLLTGRRDFSGRLAQTWPDASPLPSVLDYDVIGTGSTYLYGQGARFPVGHGLSVDRTSWSDIEVTAGPEALQVAVTVSAPAERRTDGPLHDVVQVYAQVPENSFSRRTYTVPATRLIGFDVVALDAAPTADASGAAAPSTSTTSTTTTTTTTTTTIEIPYRRLALFAPDREGWELPDGPVAVHVARSSSDSVDVREITIPRSHLEANPLPAAAGGLVPAERAEETVGLSRSATALLVGTELRPATGDPGTAVFMLDEGTLVTALETRALETGALDLEPGAADLIDADAADPSAAPALPLPHRVAADGARPTGRARVRITGPLALTGLRAERS